MMCTTSSKGLSADIGCSVAALIVYENTVSKEMIGKISLFGQNLANFGLKPKTKYDVHNLRQRAIR